MKELMLENKNITIFYDNDIKEKSIPVIIVNTYDEDGQDICDKIKKICDKEFILVIISNIDWNKEMSPWYMSKLFKDEDEYLGKADEYIEILSKRIIPKITEIINNVLNKNISNYTIAGYSLAGLFAIYCLYKTDIFTNAISCSGSLWYPNFVEYIKENDLKAIPKKVYFSLGNKESKTKNELMSKVEEKTKIIEHYFKDKNIETIYEENEGNHFQDVTNRIAKGVNWILK